MRYSEIKANMWPEANDTFRPRPMGAARVLYRSVSIPELIAIYRSGRIDGGRNQFNDFDPRKYVFFADEITPALIQQGEETERQASYAMRGHDVHRQFKRLQQEIDELANLIVHHLDRDGITYDEYLPDSLRSAHTDSLRSIVNSMFGPKRAKYTQWLDEMLQYEERLSALQNWFQRELHAEHGRITQHVAQLPYTSAIIVTKPVAGGLLYSKEFGQTGFGDREYAFNSGDIEDEDIAQVILVKDGQQVARYDWQDDGLQAIIASLMDSVS